MYKCDLIVVLRPLSFFAREKAIFIIFVIFNRPFELKFVGKANRRGLLLKFDVIVGASVCGRNISKHALVSVDVSSPLNRSSSDQGRSWHTKITHTSSRIRWNNNNVDIMEYYTRYTYMHSRMVKSCDGGGSNNSSAFAAKMMFEIYIDKVYDSANDY